MSDREHLGDGPIDKTVSAFKAAASIVPAGGFFAELVTTLIPNLRIERITTFLKQLDDRVELLEEKEAQRFHERKADPEYIALFEDGAFHAARSTSEDRIKYISSAVINGMTREHISAVEARHLLGLLNELNDIEIMWLYYCSHSLPDERRKLSLKYPDILNHISKSMGQSTEVYDAVALQDSYKDHLKRLQLIETLAGPYIMSTTLGNMVLKLVDIKSSNSNV